MRKQQFRAPRKQCLYCDSFCIEGGQGDDGLTLDHVPPKKIYAKPYPPNLFSVPSCRKCNNRFSTEIDEQFTAFLVHRLGIDREDLSELRKQRFDRSVTRGSRGVDIKVGEFTNYELIDGRKDAGRPIVELSGRSVIPMAERLVRAFYWRDYKKRLPIDIKIATATAVNWFIHLNHIQDFGRKKPQKKGRAFKYWSIKHPNEEYASAFLFEFYESWSIICYIGSEGLWPSWNVVRATGAGAPIVDQYGDIVGRRLPKR